MHNNFKLYMITRKILLIYLSFFLISLLFVTVAKNSFANDKSTSGVTNLMQSVVDGDVDGVEFFSKLNYRDINKQNIGGATALHLASRMGSLEIVKILINNGANLDIQDKEGWTALMRAASFSYESIVQELLKNGAKVNNINNQKESAMTISARVR